MRERGIIRVVYVSWLHDAIYSLYGEIYRYDTVWMRLSPVKTMSYEWF